MICRLLVPYLVGQYRGGLTRVQEVDNASWEIVELAGYTAAKVAEPREQMRRMGQIYACLAARIRQAVSAGLTPVSIAGDCLSSLGVLAGLQQASREPGQILWLDAHGDFHTWATTESQYLGGMPLAMLVGRSDGHADKHDAVVEMQQTIGVRPYPERQVILSDARDLDAGEAAALRDSGITRCSAREVLARLRRDQSLYVHFDTDVIDAEKALPALKYHVKHGPSYDEIAALFRHLREYPITAVSLSAWHEERDIGNQTAAACLALLRMLLEER
jgi:arginase